MDRHRSALTAAAMRAGSPLAAKVALLGAGTVAAATLSLLAFLGLFGVLLGERASGQTVACSLSTRGGREVPTPLVPVYRAAAARYRLGGRGASILAAINKIETDFGRNLSTSSAGAVGWMQFMPATWARYGVDGDGDGRKDPANPRDAIFAAAGYLRASGAPGNWYRAIFAYNRADWYVQQVSSLADRYQGACTTTIGAGRAVPLGDLDFTDTTGAWGGSEKFARALAALGRRWGCLPTSEKRSRKLTASGGVSDHWTGSRDAYAIDLASPTCTLDYPGGDADRTATAIAAALGIPARVGIVNQVRGAYRFQLLWQTAGHYDHVHIGVRRIR